MRFGGGITELDLHNMNVYQARTAIDACLKRANGAYMIRLIHGYHMGTELKEMIAREYACHPMVKRIESGPNPGQTILVLREL